MHFCLSMLEMNIIILFACLFKFSSNEVIVDTKSGPIRSVAALSDDVEAFLGVPYAEPPIGELRFAKPIPKKTWDEVYNASNLPPPCVQNSLQEPLYFMPDITNMSEDCLYLNIWTPKTKSTRGLRPVIVYLHQGSFVAGSSNQKELDGSHLASRGDVVVVTINYRLGALGFFLAYIEGANGNMAMYDQILAIKWVKNNAKKFGGDPENIVLMGTSAGAVAISAHIISPLSQNLFKRVILQSGGIVNPLFMDNNAKVFKCSEHIASIVGCTNETLNLRNDPHSVVKCLKSKSIEDLRGAEEILLKSNPVIFYPRANDQFLPKESASLFREGKFRKDIDVMLSINKDEGTLFLIVGLPQYFGNYGRTSVNTVNKYRAAMLSRGASMVGAFSHPSETVDFYLKSVKNRTSVGYSKMVANILGDFGVACSTIFLGDFLSLKGNPVFFYKFGYRTASSPTAEWIGTTHLDDVQYVFGNPYHANFTVEETELSHRLMDRVAAFARTGIPNIPGEIPWLRYSYHNPLYLNIGQEEESIRQKPLDRCEYWREEFKSNFDSNLIRSIRNSGMNLENTKEYLTHV